MEAHLCRGTVELVTLELAAPGCGSHLITACCKPEVGDTSSMLARWPTAIDSVSTFRDEGDRSGGDEWVLGGADRVKASSNSAKCEIEVY